MLWENINHTYQATKSISWFFSSLNSTTWSKAVLFKLEGDRFSSNPKVPLTPTFKFNNLSLLFMPAYPCEFIRKLETSTWITLVRQVLGLCFNSSGEDLPEDNVWRGKDLPKNNVRACGGLTQGQCMLGGLTWRQCVGKFDLKVCGGAVLVVPGHDDHHTPAPAHKNSYLNLE